MKDKHQYDLFVTCAPSLEPLLEQELVDLGFKHLTPGYCGIFVKDSSMESIYKINYCSRLASRVLLPLARFRCHDKGSLYRGVGAVDWTAYIPKNRTFAIDANVSHEVLRNSLYAAQIAKDAICDQLVKRTGGRPNVQVRDPDVQLNLFIHQQQAHISFDTSGSSLHKRGYRQETLEAPLKETLAAAMLRLAGYQGRESLYDPCCGSGTFLIEAALIATHTPPGYLRTKWGFMHLPSFSSESWLKLKLEADKNRIPLQKGVIFGSDINKNAVRVSKVHLRAAGFHQAVEVVVGDFRDATHAIKPTLLITNPPHGLRLGEKEYLKMLYRSLGDFMKEKMAKPSKGFVFSGDAELAKEVGLATKQKHVLMNSGVDSRLLEFDIY